MCQKHRIFKRNNKLGTLNNSWRPSEVIGMNYVHPMDGKYMLIKIDFFSQMVRLDVCDAANVASTLRGIGRWERKFELVHKIVMYQDKHFKNNGVKGWCKQQEIEVQYSVAYDHPNHGAVERCNCSDLQLLRKL